MSGRKPPLDAPPDGYETDPVGVMDAPPDGYEPAQGSVAPRVMGVPDPEIEHAPAVKVYREALKSYLQGNRELAKTKAEAALSLDSGLKEAQNMMTRMAVNPEAGTELPGPGIQPPSAAPRTDIQGLASKAVNLTKRAIPIPKADPSKGPMAYRIAQGIKDAVTFDSGLNRTVGEALAASDKGKVLKAVVDEPVRVAKGFASGVGGMVEGAGGAAEWMSKEKIGKSVREYGQKMRDFYAVEDPGFRDAVYAGFGSLATFLIPGVGISRGVQMAAFAPRLATWLGVGASSVLEAITEAGGTYVQGVQKWNDPAKASKAATKDFWLNLPTLVFTNKFGLFGDKGTAILKGLKSASGEAIQEFSQEVFGNIALGDPALKGAFEAAAVGAITGGGIKMVESLSDLVAAKEVKDQVLSPRRVPPLDFGENVAPLDEKQERAYDGGDEQPTGIERVVPDQRGIGLEPVSVPDVPGTVRPGLAVAPVDLPGTQAVPAVAEPTVETVPPDGFVAGPPDLPVQAVERPSQTEERKVFPPPQKPRVKQPKRIEVSETELSRFPTEDRPRLKSLAESFHADAVEKFNAERERFDKWREIIGRGLRAPKVLSGQRDVLGEFNTLPIWTKNNDPDLGRDIGIVADEAVAAGLLQDSKDFFEVVRKLAAPRKPLSPDSYLDEAENIISYEREYQTTEEEPGYLDALEFEGQFQAGELFEAPKENVGQTFDRLVARARGQGMTIPESVKYAKRTIAAQSRGQAPATPAAPAVQREMGTQVGVQGFGTGQRGQSEMFQAERPAVQQTTGQADALAAFNKIISTNKMTDAVFAELVDSIRVDRAAFKKGYGTEYSADKFAVRGATYPVRNHPAIKALVRFAKGAHQGTGFHEAMHVIFNNVLTNQERQVLMDKFGTEENAAEAFARYEQMRTGQEKPSRIKAIFDKLIQLIGRMRSYFDGKGWRTAEDVMRAVSEGRTDIQRQKTSEPRYQAEPKDQTETAAFKKWFGDSVITDTGKPMSQGGKPMVVYHGTTHTFDEFKTDRANVENYYGKAFYFTDSKRDVTQNYSGEGPDLAQRIELRAERIFQGMFEQKKEPKFGGVAYEKAMKKARDAARNELSGGGQTVLQTYLKMENPVILSGQNSTRFEIEFNEEDGDESGNGIELYNAVVDTAGHFGIDGQEIWDAVSQNVELSDFSAREFENAMRENEKVIYIEDPETGYLASNEFIKEVYREAGFDGIIMDADQTFGSGRKQGKQMAMDEGTKHYVVFSPTQIKSATGNTGAFDPKNPSILYQAEKVEGDKAVLPNGGYIPLAKLSKLRQIYKKYLTTDQGVGQTIDRLNEERLGKINETAFDAPLTGKELKKFFKQNPSENLKQAVFDALTGVRQISDLPAEITGAVQRMRDDVDALSRLVAQNAAPNESLRAVIERNLGQYLGRYYKLFQRKRWRPSEDVIARAKAKMRELHPKTLGQASEDELNGVIESILNRGDVTFHRGDRKMDIPQNHFIKRKDIPKEIRALYGEITDPVWAYLKTMSDQAVAAYNGEFLGKIATVEGVFKEKPTGTHFKQIPDTARWGAVRGKFTTPEVDEFLREAIDPAGDWFRFIEKAIVNPFKWTKTVASLPSHPRNLLGNAMFSVLSGNSITNPMNAPYYWKALKVIMQRDGAHRETWKELVRARVADTQFWGSEMPKMMAEMISDPVTWPEKIVEAGKWPIEKLGELYNNEDMIYRVAAFLKYREQGMTVETAAKEIDKWFTNYARLPKAVKNMRRIGVFGPFLSFKANTVKILWNAMGASAEGLKNGNPVPAMRLGFSLGFISALASAMKMAFGIDDDEAKKLEKIQELGPVYKRNSTPIYYRNSFGQVKAFDLGYIWPTGEFQKAAKAALAGDVESFVDSIDLFQHPLFDAYSVMFNNYNTKTRNKISNTNDPLPRQTADKMAELARQIYVPASSPIPSISGLMRGKYEPGLLTGYQIKTLYDTFNGVQDRFGRTREVPEELRAFFTGIRTWTVHPEDVVESYKRRKVGELFEAKQELRRYLKMRSIKKEEREKRLGDFKRRVEKIRADMKSADELLPK